MNKIHQTEFMEKFNDTIIDIPVEDMYYLLQTFSSIALARKMSDWDFIERITLDLFKVSFFINNIFDCGFEFFWHNEYFVFRLDLLISQQKSPVIRLLKIYWVT